MTPPRRPTYDLCAATHDYPDRSGPPRRSILICSEPRSGTTMLGEALYFAGGLGCPLEYFHSGFRHGFEERWNVSGTRALIAAAQRHRTDPTGVFSIKIFWQDVAKLVAEFVPGTFPDLLTTPATAVSADTYRALADLLRGLFPDPDFIHLERRDRVRQALSSLVAEQTGVYRRIGATGDAAAPVTYDGARIGALLDSTAFCQAHWHAFFAATGIDSYPLTYEALVADYAGSVAGVLERLGHPGPVPAIRMERQATAQSEALLLRFLRDQQRAPLI